MMLSAVALTMIVLVVVSMVVGFVLNFDFLWSGWVELMK